MPENVCKEMGAKWIEMSKYETSKIKVKSFTNRYKISLPKLKSRYIESDCVHLNVK